jgi:FlaA1/EpsC-like NDP-sugar epimerase
MVSRHPGIRRFLLACLDLVLLVLALGLAYEIGFDFQPERFSERYRLQFIYIVGPLVIIRIFWMWWFGLYRGFSRYAGTHELVRIILACFCGSLILILFNITCNYIPEFWKFPVHSNGHLLRVPRGVIAIDGVLAVACVSGLRIARRMLGEQMIQWRTGDRRRVMIVGAGDEGEQVVRELLRNRLDTFRPVAFVDPDRNMHGSSIRGIPVVGGLQDVEQVIRKHAVDLVVVALPKTTPAFLRDLVNHCRVARIEFQIIPPLDSMMKGHVEISRLRPVEIEDLLGRSPVDLGRFPESSRIRGCRVLVTGAGGSIGSELCRQLLLHRPTALVLMGRGENSLYEIEQELKEPATDSGVPFELVIGDIRDENLVRAVFERARPQVVFHAAAHKHVHYMEAQPGEAVKNNVRGTRLVAEASLEYGVERFVLISTDKAVRPRGMMGASKRVAELITSAMNELGETCFIAVRFGNVLGSRGSVIPLFRKQIQAGGPVTVTDPEMTRYFMTISESVSLVIEAGLQGEGGEVFMLDMGEPVKIVDLARQLISLSGFEPDTDIEIRFTGLRPGEKIHEELFNLDQEYLKTRHEKIFRLSQTVSAWSELRKVVERCEEYAADGREPELLALMREIVQDHQLDAVDFTNEMNSPSLQS